MGSAALSLSNARHGSAPRLTQAFSINGNVVSRAGGGISLVLGVSTLLGWIFGVELLKSSWAGLASMKANTAICFVLVGLALLRPRAAGVLAPVFVSVITLLTLTEYLGLKIGIDELFFQDSDPLSVSAPGRSSVFATLALLLIAGSLLLVRSAGRRALAAQTLALGAAALGWLTILGYASGVKELYGLPGLTPTAPHTALGLIAVAVAALALRPDVGVIRLLTSKAAGGALLRRLAPFIIVSPALLAWARSLGVQHDLYSANVGQWMFVSSLVVLLLVAAVTAARTVERTQRGREVAEADQPGNERILDRFFTLSLEMLCIADQHGYLRRINPAFEATLGWTMEDLTTQPFSEFVHPDDREGTDATRERLAKGDAVVGFENRYRCRDGSYRWLQWSATTAADEGLIYAVARDITERKQGEESLRQRTFDLSAANEDLSTRTVELSAANEDLSTRTLELSAANEDLSTRTLELSGANEDLFTVSLELSAANEDLSSRTVELSTANEELEAFAYSVSHDLRAPLRAIDGFSQAVLEEYSEKLDQTGQDYLSRLRSASQRMGLLIDDMLSLSRVSRVEMSHARVDLSTIATSVAAELQAREPDRQVEFVIEGDVTALGDARFLRIVLENSLANSFKFTAKHPAARIEFGREDVDGEDVYFVRDNGAGFDMAYADQLFVPFHRLHSAKDFPGSGIGLATIRRIATRHGGRAWAHGEVGRGATVYFSLGGTDDQ